MKPIRITALAEFDLAEAQDFYAPHGAWVVGHYFPFSVYYDVIGNNVIVKAVLDDRFGPDRIAAHFGPLPAS